MNKESRFGFEFIRINPNEEDFDVFVEIGKIYNHINKSNEKLKNLKNQLKNQLKNL